MSHSLRADTPGAGAGGKLRTQPASPKTMRKGRTKWSLFFKISHLFSSKNSPLFWDYSLPTFFEGDVNMTFLLWNSSDAESGVFVSLTPSSGQKEEKTITTINTQQPKQRSKEKVVGHKNSKTENHWPHSIGKPRFRELESFVQDHPEIQLLHVNLSIPKASGA